MKPKSGIGGGYQHTKENYNSYPSVTIRLNFSTVFACQPRTLDDVPYGIKEQGDNRSQHSVKERSATIRPNLRDDNSGKAADKSGAHLANE